MSERTRVIVNRGRVVPFTLAQKGLEYPDVDGVLAEVRAVASDVVAVDGEGLAQAAGDRRALNAVMLGALAGLEVLPFDGDVVWQAVARRLASRPLEVNRRAFELGREAVSS
jgi:indolepyruvate ferredoxin oxidoreductase beta subunit